MSGQKTAVWKFVKAFTELHTCPIALCCFVCCRMPFFPEASQNFQLLECWEDVSSDPISELDLAIRIFDLVKTTNTDTK